LLDRTFPGPRRGRPRINLTEEYELAFWTGRFDLREDDPADDELLEAIRAVGNSEREVENYLKARNACSGGP